MVPGFKQRLEEELRHYIKTIPKYADLMTIEHRIRFIDNINPPNIISWIGASLLGSLNDEIGLFLYSPKLHGREYIPDRFGTVFLKPYRDEVEEERFSDSLQIGATREYRGKADPMRFEEEKEEQKSKDDRWIIPRTQRIFNYFNGEFEVAMKKFKLSFYSQATPYSTGRGMFT